MLSNENRSANRWHVISNKGGWIVRRDRAERATKQFDSQADAVRLAHSLARRAAGEVIVHQLDGRIDTQEVVMEDGTFRVVYRADQDLASPMRSN